MKKAFTLIELIFVIVIIGLLAAVSVPKFITAVQNAKYKPALIITKEIMRKWEEQYQELQDANISRVVLKNPHIMKYLNELTTHIDKRFVWDVRDYYPSKYDNKNYTVFAIGYKSYKDIPGNVYYSKPGGSSASQDPKPDGTPLPVDDKYIEWFHGTPSSRRTKGVTGCIQVGIRQEQVPVSVDKNITQYKLVIVRNNPSCMKVE